MKKNTILDMEENTILDMEEIADLYETPRVSRKSPGIFGYLNTFQSTSFLILLAIGLPLSIGGIVTLFQWYTKGTIYWWYWVRDASTFAIIPLLGTLGCVIFRKRTPLFNFKLAYLMNSYATVWFALSYILGHFLDVFSGEEQQFVEIFFLIGALISYIVLFMVYFSFTSVGPPWYIFLALIQPISGILIYSFYFEQITLLFFLKAMIFFMISALIFAVVYGPMMATVSNIYRRKTGVGGYNFIRAFVESLLLEDHDDSIERYFESFSEPRDLKIQYVALKQPGTKKAKGLFVIPNVHFGPFKTAGSASLSEEIYRTFEDIPGITVFHTTTSHGQNLATKKLNSKVISTIQEDLSKFEYKQPHITRFHREYHDKTKVLGTIIDNTPFLMFTRHPYPTDDIVPKIGEEIKKVGFENNYKESVVIDCHNSLIGDEFLVNTDSEEAKGMIQTSKQFFQHLLLEKRKYYEKITYGTARDPMNDIPIANGIGAGGIIVHYFKIDQQETALIHVDANNASTNVRSAVVNLGENEGLDRIELSTSDTHAVVRIISAQGYYPLGTKISTSQLISRIKPLIIKARENASEVEIATHSSISSGFRFWKDLSYFDLIMETIERCLSVSKVLLTIGLVFPSIVALLIMLFYY